MLGTGGVHIGSSANSEVSKKQHAAAYTRNAGIALLRGAKAFTVSPLYHGGGFKSNVMGTWFCGHGSIVRGVTISPPARTRTGVLVGSAESAELSCGNPSAIPDNQVRKECFASTEEKGWRFKARLGPSGPAHGPQVGLYHFRNQFSKAIPRDPSEFGSRLSAIPA